MATLENPLVLVAMPNHLGPEQLLLLVGQALLVGIGGLELGRPASAAEAHQRLLAVEVLVDGEAEVLVTKEGGLELRRGAVHTLWHKRGAGNGHLLELRPSREST
jgi:hypothetical protein